MKTKLLLFLMLISTIGYSQTQPVVHNKTFDLLPKASGSDCTCTGWINKDIADQGESSSQNSSDVVKLDDLESDGIYQEFAVIPNSDYELDLEYTYKLATTTTNFIEVIVLKGSGYDNNLPYDPTSNYVADPFDANQSGYGYTLTGVNTPANQLSYTTIIPPGDTSTHSMSQVTFNTGSETSVALFIRAVGPYLPGSHGDPTKDKGWMNGDSEVRIDNLSLVNTTNLSAEDFIKESVKVFPNPT
jgi:hypothetical protein